MTYEELLTKLDAELDGCGKPLYPPKRDIVPERKYNPDKVRVPERTPERKDKVPIKEK